MPKFEVGSRFYIHSRNEVSPTRRPPGNGILVVISHGYHEPDCGNATVRGLGMDGRCTFYARHGHDADVEDISASLGEMVSNRQSNGGFYETPAANGVAVCNYTLVKGMDKKMKGASDYRYVDSIYIDSIYPDNAHYDIIALHNRWYKSDKVRLSELFSTLATHCNGVYDRLYCGFCRESIEQAMR